MNPKSQIPSFTILALCVTLLSSCGGGDSADADSSGAVTPPSEVKVASVEIGRKAGGAGGALTAAATFRPTDTIHVAVSTIGSMPDVSVLLMVTFLEDSTQLMHENKVRTLAGPEMMDFTLWNTSGLKPGKYEASIFLNGALAAIKDFAIQR